MKVKILGNRELKDGTITVMVAVVPEDEDEFFAIRKSARAGKAVALSVEETIVEDSRISRIIKAITPIIQTQVDNAYHDGVQEGANKQEKKEENTQCLLQ